MQGRLSRAEVVALMKRTRSVSTLTYAECPHHTPINQHCPLVLLGQRFIACTLNACILASGRGHLLAAAAPSVVICYADLSTNTPGCGPCRGMHCAPRFIP